MADTAQKVINKALTQLGVKLLGVDVTAQQYTDGIESLNDMMTELDAEGITLGYTMISAKEDIVTVPEYALGFIKTRLALKLASDYQINPTANLQNSAMSSKEAVLMKLVRENKRKAGFPETLPLGGDYYSGEAVFPVNEDIDAITVGGNYITDDQGFIVAGSDETEESSQ